MVLLFLLILLIPSQCFCASECSPRQRRRIVSSGGFVPAVQDIAKEVPARFISYTCDQEEIVFDTQFLETTFKHSLSFQNRYSRNKTFENLINAFCQGLKKDQVKLLIAAIGKNNEAIQGRIDSAHIFSQQIQEKDFPWLLKKTRNYGIDYVYSALIHRIASDPSFAHTISDSCQLTESTYFAISSKIDREKLHEIISGDLREIVRFDCQSGMIKSIFFDKDDSSKMVVAGSLGTLLYDLSKREIVQQFLLKSIPKNGLVCRNRSGNYCFELNDGQVFLWELQFRPARRSELKLEKGVISMGLNNSDTQFFAQYRDKLLVYDLETATSKEVSFAKEGDFLQSHEDSISAYYKDDDTLCIKWGGNFCMYDPKSEKSRIVRLPENVYKDSSEIVYNDQGTQALLKCNDTLHMYDFEKELKVDIRLPIKPSEQLVGAQYCDNDSKLLLRTGYRIYVYDMQTRSCTASYPILPEYDKLIYRSKTVIAVHGSSSMFVLYPDIVLRDLDPKQILFLFKASSSWHINKKYMLKKDDFEVFNSLPEQIKSYLLFDSQ